MSCVFTILEGCSRIRRFVPVWLLGASVLLAVSFAAAQEKSVRPGINKAFKNPNVKKFIGRFEREGRDVFDHRQQIVTACNIKPGMAVADIGAGTGLFTGLFSPLAGSDGKIYAVDIAENFVKHIEQRCREQSIKNVVGVVCGHESVNLEPGSIDLAFICDTYHHFEFPQKTMRSVHRALRPGGQVILIDFRRVEGVSDKWVLDHVRAGQKTFTKEVIAAGFKQVEEKKFLKESYFVRFKKVPVQARRQ